MFDADVIRVRIEAAERYLELLDKGFAGSWHDARRHALVSGDLVLAMSLVHPEHWRDQRSGQEILGPREFRTPVLLGTRYCAAADYWGVACASIGRREVEIVADHAWPYSLGGPTEVGNIRWLCRRHNAAKSSDVHLYPWGSLWPDWLDRQLEKIARIL